jgi:hypothetical protein
MNMTETVQTEEAKAPVKKVIKSLAPKLTPDRFKAAEFVRVVYAVTPAVNTDLDHILKPEYWSHVAANLSPLSRIEVVAEDNSWFAELIVLSSGLNWAKVRLLRYIPLVDGFPEEKKQEDDFEILYAGVKARFRVIRKSDRTTVKEGFPSQQEALKWVREYEINALI